MMELIEMALATGGTALHGNPLIGAVSTDTRTVASGELFVALKGERFDGHDFVQAAVERGAAAAMVARDWAEKHEPVAPVVVVADTRLALGQLAAYWRAKFAIPLVGITGSNGKTTVKEMTAACLRTQARADGYDPELAVLATTGNLNNDIGLPLMLLRLHITHRAAVLEMGMNHPGEIAHLARIARPTVAVLNNAQRAHLAGLGSVADVARAKAEIFEGLGEHDTAVINADDPFCGYWTGLNAGRRVLTFGLDNPADVRATCRPKALSCALSIATPWGAVETTLRVPGLHNARNALAAAAAALAAGASTAAVGEGLAGFSGVKGRLQVRAAVAGATLIDDTYNANPDSMRAAIDVLAATPGRKILVLGDMGEIGGQAGQFHDEIGGYAKSQGVDLLLALGEQSELAARNFGAGGRHFADLEALVAALRPELTADTAVLVKGSRFMRMERVADAIALKGETHAS
ncbi:MAG: UDP-N-acetylmuramoyl-tripeptide--D-alanyl-D-alanine ligase [Rhodocyclales bacterium]|nr:UDP-N-acetylmuramoyl-tripeptide--D-alanyl-D-alanine ligase [Rhodocyclales bacterium]